MNSLKDKSLEELKVLAYDTMVKIQIEQNNLQVINQEIAKKEEGKNGIVG